jgi:hypothetical protein
MCISSSFRIRLFRGLTVIVAGLVVVSFATSWWNAEIINAIAGVVGKVSIYPYGLKHTLVEYASYLAADETPFYHTVFAWIYLAVSVGLIVFSAWLKGKSNMWLLGGIGFTYVVYAVIAITWIASRAGDFGISLQGWSIEEIDKASSVLSSIQPGYYLALATGFVCMALAVFRDKIVGKTKIIT